MVSFYSRVFSSAGDQLDSDPAVNCKNTSHRSKTGEVELDRPGPVGASSQC